MRFDVLSLFPQMIDAYCNESIIKLAREKKLLEINTHNPRDFSTNKHKQVDDTPYGGGSGMLIGPQAYIDCLDDVCKSNKPDEIIITSPHGKPLTQALAQELSQKKHLLLMCGRYEGLDQRIVDRSTLEISLGDFILTGGELAAMTIIDATSRLIPGVLGDDHSSFEESFSEIDYLDKCQELGVSKKELNELLSETGLKDKEDLKSLTLLEYPHYTRPADFRGEKVPSILESGDHKKIFLWRLKEAIKITKNKRPDLIQ